MDLMVVQSMNPLGLVMAVPIGLTQQALKGLLFLCSVCLVCNANM